MKKKPMIITAVIVIIVVIGILSVPIIPSTLPGTPSKSIFNVIIENAASQSPFGLGPQTYPEVNGTSFVDTITKIPIEQSAQRIQKALDERSYAPIVVSITSEGNVDLILSSLTEEEFKLKDLTRVLPPIISGNATKIAIEKLQANPNITRIYYDTGSTIPTLQSTPYQINANIVWNLQQNFLNITGENVTVCIVDTGINYTCPDLGGCEQTNNISTANCSRIIGGFDYLENPDDWDPMDTVGHGTHVTGISDRRMLV